MANRNFASGGKFYSMHVMPVLVDCQFTVDSTNVIGISNLKGPLVSAVYMHSAAATPTGPNPLAGNIIVRLQDNYNKLLSSTNASIVALSGADVKIDNSAMTANAAYVITTLGNATAAKWHAIGVPAGVTPAVGVSFIAASNGGAGNTLTSRVQAPATAGSNIMTVSLIGQPDKSIAPDPAANQGYGAQLILQCRDASGALANPTDGAVVQLQFLMSNSSITIAGE